jgi:hypothetical protein
MVWFCDWQALFQRYWFAWSWLVGVGSFRIPKKLFFGLDRSAAYGVGFVAECGLQHYVNPNALAIGGFFQ